MLTNEVKEKIKGKSRDELLDAIKSGMLEVPKSDRKEFMRLVGMSPEDRDKELSGDGAGQQDPSVSSSSDTGDEGNQSGDAGQVSNQDKNWWEDLGYESAEKAMEAHKSLLDLSSRQQHTIDNLNAEGGKRGQRLKQLEEEHAKVLRELQELREKMEPKLEAPVKPTKPVRPNPKDYEEDGIDGVYSEKYMRDLEKFETERDLYDTNLDKYYEDLAEYNQKSILKKVEEKLNVPARERPATEVDSGPWDELFNKVIPEFQNEFQLQTTVSVRSISDAFTAINSPKANAEQKIRAKALLDSLPDEDLKKYKKIRDAVDMAYTFESGGPVPKYKKIKSALVDNDLVGAGKPYNYVQPASYTPEELEAMRRKQDNGSVSAIPAAAAAGADRMVSEPQTMDEKKKRLIALNDKYNSALNGGLRAREEFEASSDYKEYLTLRSELQPKKRGGSR